MRYGDESGTRDLGTPFFSMPSGADVAIYGKNMINLLIYGIYGIYIYIDTYIYGIYGHP